ncbi:MAG: SDR family oxidoreductase [Paracoccaceae bacterium]|nr:SDR family oxidoreductase [Paracoccaceae bacterium]
MSKAAIVTGAARGIGRAIAQRMAQEGWRVLVADLDSAAAEETAAEIGATPCQVNVLDAGSVTAMVEAANAAFGCLDVLVSNAGIMDRMPFLEMTEDFWHRVIDTNLTGTFLCGQAAARRMVVQGAGGRIVNVASNSGLFGGRGRAAYGASKAGIINLTQTMAIELAEHGILVNAVAPGPTKTSDAQPDEPWPSVKARMPLGRWGKPREIAEVALFLASDACSFTTGHVWCADGGYTVAGIMEG